MSEIVWDKLEERFFDQGVDHGVLYDSEAGAYVNGVAWNGLVNVTQSPSGAEPNKQYADNIVYVNLLSLEEFSATIEAFMAPDKFDKYNGIGRTANGMQVGQQTRGTFGFSWRTGRGNAENPDLGYVINIAYGCQASPSELAHATKSDTPELVTMSWSLSTTPVAVSGYKPTALVKIDSTDPTVDPANLAALESILYGSAGVEPRLPLPDEVESILGAGVVSTVPVAPTFDGPTNTITIPADPTQDYYSKGELLADGPLVITEDTVVEARAASGHNFEGTFVTSWLYEHTGVAGDSQQSEPRRPQSQAPQRPEQES